MVHDIVAILGGLVLLVIGGDVLVRGAVSLALRLGIPALVVSLTIVAFGTSAPELLIAIQSAFEGAPGIAFGNVVGSNIANVLLVLGLPALISPIEPAESESRHTFIQMIGATLLVIVVCFFGPLGPVHGTILLAALFFIMWNMLAKARAGRTELMDEASCDPETLDEGDPSLPGWKLTLMILGGLLALPLGADFLVDGAVGVARRFHVPDAVIGLTIVAIGTSLPELATAVAAALRRQSDVAIGNVIGSNLFNILGILGVAAFFAPLPVPPGFLRADLWIMLAASLALLPFVYGNWCLTRRWGLAFLGAYVLYLVMVVT